MPCWTSVTYTRPRYFFVGPLGSLGILMTTLQTLLDGLSDTLFFAGALAAGAFTAGFVSTLTVFLTTRATFLGAAMTTFFVVSRDFFVVLAIVISLVEIDMDADVQP